VIVTGTDFAVGGIGVESATGWGAALASTPIAETGGAGAADADAGVVVAFA
jgi:hypothetical protein